MIRVCLVDDQTLVRQGIRSLLALADGIEVVAEAADGKQAVEQIPQAAPDVVLIPRGRVRARSAPKEQLLPGTSQAPGPRG